MAKAKKLHYTNKFKTEVNKSKAFGRVLSEVLGNSKSYRNIGELIINGHTCNDEGIKPNQAKTFFH